MVASPVLLSDSAVTIDVSDPERSAEFWGTLLGLEPGKPRSNGEYLTVGQLCEGTLLVLQRVPETKTQKNRVHLDFRVEDVDAAKERIVQLGGKQVSEPRRGGGVTMADPDGNEFCIGSFARDITGRRIYS